MNSEKQIKKHVFFVDKQKFETAEDQLTVRQILIDFAKVNPDENVLVQVHGSDLHELNDLNQVIEIQNGMKFTIFNKKPTPVS